MTRSVDIAPLDEALTFACARTEDGGRLIAVRSYREGQITGVDLTALLTHPSEDAIDLINRLGQEAVRAFGALSGNTLESGAAITLGALVSLETPGEQTHYFLGPFAGGTEIVHAGEEVVAITPASALGQKLIAKRAGDTIALRPGVSAKVVAVA